MSNTTTSTIPPPNSPDPVLPQLPNDSSFSDCVREPQQCQQDHPLESVFDSTTEFFKSIVREIFHFSSQSIDGVCAAILHLAQSKELETYYLQRIHRMRGDKGEEIMQDDMGQGRDKLVEIYLNKMLIKNNHIEPY